MADQKISQLTGATTPLAGTEVLPIVQSGSTKKVAVSDLTAGRSVSMKNLTVTNTGFQLADLTRTGISGLVIGADNGGALFAPKTVDAIQFYNAAITTQIFAFNTSNGNLTAQTGNYVPATAGKGVDFSANTGAAGKTSTLLNWYEEGTWTPVVEGSTSAGTASYSLQNGRYTRIGRQVYIEVALAWSGGTGTGNLYITGLPFTSANGGTVSAMSIALADFLALTAANVLTAFVPANTTRIEAWQYPSGGGAANNVAYDASATIYFSGTYTV